MRSLADRKEAIRRKLFGHGIRYDEDYSRQVFVEKANPGRKFRLLMALAKIHNEELEIIIRERRHE